MASTFLIIEFILAAIGGFVAAIIIDRLYIRKKELKIPKDIVEKIESQKQKTFIMGGKKYDLSKYAQEGLSSGEEIVPEPEPDIAELPEMPKKIKEVVKEIKEEKVSVADLMKSQK